jgi:hypothetical protein
MPWPSSKRKTAWITSATVAKRRDGISRIETVAAFPYLNPITMESGPTKCSTRALAKPVSRIHCWQSAPV